MKEKIPKGYERTQIGIIPEDWEVKRLEEILKYVLNANFLLKIKNFLAILRRSSKNRTVINIWG